MSPDLVATLYKKSLNTKLIRVADAYVGVLAKDLNPGFDSFYGGNVLFRHENKTFAYGTTFGTWVL